MNRDMSKYEIYHLRLGKTYFNKGHFNITRDFDHLVRSDEGPVTLQLRGDTGSIGGRVDRRSQGNGTARVKGGAPLGDWLQRNYAMGDMVPVTFYSPSLLVIG